MNTELKTKRADELNRNDFPPGTVAIPCHDLARYHHFTHDLIVLDVPDKTEISMFRSSSIVQNMNEMVMRMDENSEWLWVIGDDHTFERNTVLNLLKHDEDIIVPLCTKRGPPFSLVAFDEVEGQDDHGRNIYHVVQWEELPKKGELVELAAAGTAGMLIKRRVLDDMEFPWFQNSDGLCANEDVEFCRRARELGYKVKLDTGTRIGHIGVIVALPSVREGKWGLELDFQGSGPNNIFIPGGIRPDDSGTPHTGTGIVERG